MLYLYYFEILVAVLGTTEHRGGICSGDYFSLVIITGKSKPLRESKLGLGVLLQPAVAARWHSASVRDGLRDGLCPFPQSPETGHLLN